MADDEKGNLSVSNAAEFKVSATGAEDSESGSGIHTEIEIDKVAEKKLLWKLDLLILPILFLFYMMSYLDRVNIGNARIQGMDKELELNVDNRYNIALLLFFPIYIVLEIPSNMLLKHVRPSLFLPGLVFFWGIINMCTGFVQSYKTLYVLRVLLGIFEAGLVPGVIYVTSMYYRRHEYQKRLSLMFVATSIGGAFGGLLAYGIAHLGGQQGYAGWRWIFIIEGALTAFIGLVSPFIVVDWPDQCRHLNQDEKDLIRNRLRDDGGEFRMDKLDSFGVKRIILDWKIWLGALGYMGFTTSGLAMSFFLPTVLNDFGWASTDAQVHTVPVYLVAVALTLGLSWASDALKHRYSFIMFCFLLTVVGYGMALNQEHLSRGAKYAGCFLIAGGGLAGGPLCIVLLSNNLSGHWKRAVGSAVQVSFGGIAGLMGSLIFMEREKPDYRTGYTVGLAMACVAGLAPTIMMVGMWIENRKRDRGERDERLSWPTERLNNLGDYHPGFRFTW
ncbi:major facilitator superfamily domain-containing protein [Chaetomium sp. MPI-SDFR-AT-0129]|nr:major facilitator superfamily domain-containing protein [Chaetomium sp. MPI-SDFR-AT-0129]